MVPRETCPNVDHHRICQKEMVISIRGNTTTSVNSVVGPLFAFQKIL